MRFPIALSAAILLASSTIALAYGTQHFTVGNMPSYYQGTFGTNRNISIFYDATYFQFQNNRLRLKLTVPYISVVGLPKGAQLASGGVSTHSSTAQTHNASGLGDIWLAAHYRVFQGRGLLPAVVPYAKIKFGTASSSQGLGTGRNDYELGFGLDETIGTRIFPFVHLGYRFVGNPSGQNLRNILTYDAGSSFAVTKSNVLTVMYSGSQSEQPNYSGPSDLIVAWNYNVTRAGSGFQVYADKGLSNGSADYGVGAGAQIVF